MNDPQERIFFSYARADGEFALRLATDLRSHGLSVWLDQLDIDPGERWDRAIEEALEASPSVLVILSPQAVDSANVMDEVSYALEEGKTTIPVLHLQCKIPFRLRRLQHIDFLSDYDQGLERLVKALHGTSQDSSRELVAETEPLQEELPDEVTLEPADDYSGEYDSPDQSTARPQPAAAGPARASVDRKAGALFGALIGAAYGGISAFVIYVGDQRTSTVLRLLEPVAAYALVAAVAGAIAGAIAGKSAKALLSIFIAILIVVIAWIRMWGTYADVVATGMMLGGGAAAIIVAGIWAFRSR